MRKKKILFISTKNPFSDNFSGDRLVSSKIITFFKKQKKVSKIDIVCTEHKKFLKKNLSKYNLKVFSFPNFALRLLNVFISFRNALLPGVDLIKLKISLYLSLPELL